MARRRGFDLRDAPQLQPFLLPDVRTTGRTIGGGAWGIVEELDVQGLLCAGKKLHAVFFEPERQDAARILQRFVEECSLLADLRHPHIVQFLGICFLGGSDLPVLVMEYLPYCLDRLLEGYGKVKLPIAMKCSILRDVALGLNHMHARIPPIIHRDLTAKNILLTAGMTGKIADLGVACILNLEPGRLAVTMTQTPGTLAYMPPEALEENPKYNSAIDMFSFGHLALYTIVQDFPHPTAPNCKDPGNPEMLLGRSEVQRRSRHIERLSHELGGERHCLVQLITLCLHNDPRQRPLAKQVLSQLEEMRSHVEDRYEHMSKLELIQVLRRKEEGEGEGALQAQVTQLEEQLQAQVLELEASRAKTQKAHYQLQEMAVALEASQAETQQVQDQLQVSQSEAQQYRSQIQQVQGQLQASQVEAQLRLQQSEDALRKRDQAIQKLQAQLRRTEAEAIERTRTTHQAQAHQPLWSLNWEQGMDMLFETSVACAVVLNGKVYLGGGGADGVEDQFIVLVYAPEKKRWSKLPKCPVKAFAMAVLKRQLVLVGGLSHDHLDQSTLHVLDRTAQHWTTPYTNMPTARRSPAAIGYQQFLVVAGGRGVSYLATVEILNTSTNLWYAAAQLPAGCCALTPALVGETLYLLGGWSGPGSANEDMFSKSLPDLVSHATSTPQVPTPTWDTMDAKLTFSSSVSCKNALLAIGGMDDRDRHSSTIHLFNPQTRQWTKIGGMPVPLSQCSCAVLSSTELVLLGGRGEGGRRSNKVYFGTVN